jgi:hypothetical protein
MSTERMLVRAMHEQPVVVVLAILLLTLIVRAMKQTPRVIAGLPARILTIQRDCRVALARSTQTHVVERPLLAPHITNDSRWSSVSFVR